MQVLSIDAATGGVQWQFNAGNPVNATFIQQFLQAAYGPTCEYHITVKLKYLAAV